MPDTMMTGITPGYPLLPLTACVARLAQRVEPIALKVIAATKSSDPSVVTDAVDMVWSCAIADFGSDYWIGRVIGALDKTYVEAASDDLGFKALTIIREAASTIGLIKRCMSYKSTESMYSVVHRDLSAVMDRGSSWGEEQLKTEVTHDRILLDSLLSGKRVLQYKGIDPGPTGPFGKLWQGRLPERFTPVRHELKALVVPAYPGISPADLVRDKPVFLLYFSGESGPDNFKVLVDDAVYLSNRIHNFWKEKRAELPIPRPGIVLYVPPEIRDVNGLRLNLSRLQISSVTQSDLLGDPPTSVEAFCEAFSDTLLNWTDRRARDSWRRPKATARPMEFRFPTPAAASTYEPNATKISALNYRYATLLERLSS